MPNISNRSSRTRQSSSDHNPPPYNFVSFPTGNPVKQPAAGHKKYLPKCFHGSLSLVLEVKTAFHSATGITVMGREVQQPRIDLIKTMVQQENKPIIQGSSLKGCIRSVYEAITNSRLGVVSSKTEEIKQGKYPGNRLPCQNPDELCPASAVFGASGDKWGLRSLIDFQDAHCESISTFDIGFMPSLWSPKPEQCDAYFKDNQLAGRKFYYHMTHALDKGSVEKGIPVQQVGKAYQFTTTLRFKNLRPEEIGALFIILGQDPDYPLALKIGGGKPIGMGTMTAITTDLYIVNNFKTHYSSYEAQPDHLTGQKLNDFIFSQIREAKEKQLVQLAQLQEIYAILGYGKTEITRQPHENYSWKPRR